ncbi:MAG: ATP-binding protein [Candidatus Fimivivens sp.]|nr:ATP-binding protein [Candidatus Fimivivens sp.]
MLVSMLVVLLSLGITLYFDMTRQRKDMDLAISGTAAYIASMPGVVTMLEEGYPAPQVRESLDSLCSNIPNISVAVVCDKDGLRFFHTDRQRTGESYVDGEEAAILQGAEPYITIGYGTMGMQRRAFHAVYTDKNDIIGFVMVSVFTGVISAHLSSILLLHLIIFFGMMAVSFLLSHGILAYLRKTLMGLQPEELLSRYLQQDEVLGAIAEGLVASDTAGNVLFINAAARKIIGISDEMEGRPLIELLPDTRLEMVLSSGEPENHRSWIVGGHSVLASEIPIRNSVLAPIQGVLTILYDRTEMLHMSDQLFGARSMIDALRSYNHEFSNKMHVILGYLESGEIQKAMRFILNSNLISGQLICQTADQIRVSELCALIIGKIIHASERGISLTLANDSCCIEQDLLLPSSEMMTLIGNLLENAIEEVSGSTVDIREINCGIYCRPDCNIIVCEDTGRGISDEVFEKMYENGYSTKGEYRGTGLFTVKRIVSQYGGKIEVETELGEGTAFTVTFAREDMRECIR